MAANSQSFRFAGCPRRKSNLAWFLAALFLPFATPVGAQQTEVSLKLDVVAWGDEIGGLSFKSGERAGDITALSFRYSAPVSYSGPALMEIFKNGDGDIKPKPEASAEDLQHQLRPLKTVASAANKDAPAKQGIALELEKRREKAPNLVALAALPSGCRRATVLLAPVGDGTFFAYVINDDPSKLPLGQLRIHNLSPHSIAMRFSGAAPKEIKARGSIIIPVVNEQISYDLAYQLGTEWKFQEHNFLPIYAKDQTQMIVLKSNNSFFLSSDGSSGGYLQAVTLRRGPSTQ
jgi:hypothetical protein